MNNFRNKSDILHTENTNLKKSLEKERLNAKRGLLWTGPLLKDNNSKEVEYDPKETFSFLIDDVIELSNIHPNLIEHAKLNLYCGLFKITNEKEVPLVDITKKYPVKTGDVFQIRGYDLASMTLVYDGSGWVVMDVLTTCERAKAAWENIVVKFFEIATINTVIYSHSHVDHYGGIGGLKSYFDKDCFILAPDGFTKHAVSENIHVGTTMKRRAIYQYGSYLPINADGLVDCGLGKEVSRGTNTIIVPTREIGFTDYLEGEKYCLYNASERIVESTLDQVAKSKACQDLCLQIQYTPETEAPAEMNVYIPSNRVLFIAENCTGTLHNTLTPRGAEVRDPLAWANFLDEVLITFSDLEIVCSSHNQPRFGHEECIRYIEIQRDMYRYINNATLHLANLGYTIDEVGRMLSGEDGTMPLPKAFIEEWCCHGFYGTYNHDAKAVYQKYIGWYDGNPVHLNMHKPSDRATRYVKAFGVDTIQSIALEALNEKDYAWAVELYDHLLNANSKYVRDDQLEQIKHDFAYALKQMAFESESPSWRNMYLTGASEVLAYNRNSMEIKNNNYLSFPDDTIATMSIDMILQYLGIMLDSRKVNANDYRLTLCINLDGECANGNIGHAVFNYRSLDSIDKLNQNADIQINGTKISFFRAFVDHDYNQLKYLIDGKKKQEEAKKFIHEYLTRFTLNFPIMTPRKKY